MGDRIKAMKKDLDRHNVNLISKFDGLGEAVQES